MEALIDELLTMNYVAVALPLFGALIGLELVVGWRKRSQFHRLNDALSSVSATVVQQISRVYVSAFCFLAYIWVFDHWALISFEKADVLAKLLAFFVLFLGVDLLYYWFHRASHRINLLWGAHEVHHQSEEYNLTTSLRHSAFHEVLASPFYIPLAFVGFPLTWTASMLSLSASYQFCVHTRLVKRLPGWCEAVLVTPSHHRVHHGRNVEYIDKNYGGVLIVWDRLFNSFTVERQEPTYGVLRPLRSFDPMWSQIRWYTQLVNASVSKLRGLDRLRLWAMPPGWRPSESPLEPATELPDSTKFDPRIGSRARALAIGTFAAGLACVVIGPATGAGVGLSHVAGLGLLWSSGRFFGAARPTADPIGDASVVSTRGVSRAAP